MVLQGGRRLINNFFSREENNESVQCSSDLDSPSPVLIRRLICFNQATIMIVACRDSGIHAILT